MLFLALLVVHVAAFCTENCFDPTYCNPKCMNLACNYVGYQACLDLWPARTCEGSTCGIDEFYDHNTDCWHSDTCPVNTFYERCLGLDSTSEDDSCAEILSGAPAGDPGATFNLLVSALVVDAGPYGYQPGTCAECGPNFSFKAQGANFLELRKACEFVSVPSGRCGPPRKLTDLCTDPICKFCAEALGRTCPPRIGKADLVSVCAPGCNLDMLGNGVCDETCQTASCRYDHVDCERSGCGDRRQNYRPTEFKLEFSNPLNEHKTCTRELFTISLDGDEDPQGNWRLGNNCGPVILFNQNYTSCLHIVVNAQRYEWSLFTAPKINGLCQVLDPQNNCQPTNPDNVWLVDNELGPYDGFCTVYPVVDTASTSMPASVFGPGRDFSMRITTYTDIDTNNDGDAEKYRLLSRPRECDWSQVGNGVCEEECFRDACLYDLGDCKGNTDFADPEGCPPDYIGDLYCDEECFSEEYQYDGGDCFCDPNCPHVLLFNDVCDQACNIEACNYDWGACDCAPDCTRPMQDSIEVCHPECNVLECDYQRGRCQFEKDYGKYDDYSQFTFVIYNQGGWDDDQEECPNLKEHEEKEKVYDNDEYLRKKDDDEDEKELYKPGWESSGASKYFDQCYSSYRFGYYIVQWDDNNDEDHEHISIQFNCDIFCEECEDSFNEVENEACVSEGDLSFKIKFEYKEPEAASSIVAASLLMFVLKALYLIC